MKNSAVSLALILSASLTPTNADVSSSISTSVHNKINLSSSGIQQKKSPFNNDNIISSSDILLIPRGGAKSSKKKKSASKRSATGNKVVTGGKDTSPESSPVGSLMEKYKNVLPLTRLYITLIGVVTLISLIVGEEMGQAILALDPIRTLYGFEFWRIFTAASFLGPPSIGWLMSAYYLFEYGSSLERAFGTPQHVIFLIGQIIVLTCMSILLGQPFFGQSMITAMLHVLSRSMPNQKVKWLIFTVPYWSLPYGLMASDVLQAGSPMAALPHIMGIISGHVYFFHKFVWPKLGGEDWVVPPQFLVDRLDPDAKKGKDKINDALKNRKKTKGKGRKLGS